MRRQPATPPNPNYHNFEGDILRYVFFHSLALAALVGLMVFLQAYVFPFTRLAVC